MEQYPESPTLKRIKTREAAAAKARHEIAERARECQPLVAQIDRVLRGSVSHRDTLEPMGNAFRGFGGPELILTLFAANGIDTSDLRVESKPASSYQEVTVYKGDNPTPIYSEGFSDPYSNDSVEDEALDLL